MSSWIMPFPSQTATADATMHFNQDILLLSAGFGCCCNWATFIQISQSDLDEDNLISASKKEMK